MCNDSTCRHFVERWLAVFFCCLSSLTGESCLALTTERSKENKRRRRWENGIISVDEGIIINFIFDFFY